MTSIATAVLVCVDGPAACRGAVQLHWLTYDTDRRLRCRAHTEAFQARTGGDPADLAPEHCTRRPARVRRAHRAALARLRHPQLRAL